MKRLLFKEIAVFTVSLLLLLMPAMVHAQSEPVKPSPPPIAQTLVREGDFAVKLLFALGLGTTDDEAEAESQLGEVGISPRNGWIADYPVTPDIVGELQKAVSDAVDSKKLSMNKDEALKRLNDVSAGFVLSVKPYTAGKTYETLPESAENYPNPTEINNYYYSEGPPVVTYYAPPPDFYYLYSWVPYPFWWYGFWFPGFFILHDFHRAVFVHHRVSFVSNHFNGIGAHRVYRIDPVARFHGRTFAGIGVPYRRGFISTGVPRSERRIFNGPHTWGGPGGRAISPPYRGGRSYVSPPRGGRSHGPSVGRGRSHSISPRGGGAFSRGRQRR